MTFHSTYHLSTRGVFRGGGGGEGAVAPPEFGRSVNPIQTRGTDFTPHTTASPPGFKKLSTPLSTQNHTFDMSFRKKVYK